MVVTRYCINELDSSWERILVMPRSQSIRIQHHHCGQIKQLNIIMENNALKKVTFLKLRFARTTLTTRSHVSSDTTKRGIFSAINTFAPHFHPVRRCTRVGSVQCTGTQRTRNSPIPDCLLALPPFEILVALLCNFDF